MGDFDPAKESFATITNRHGLRVFVKQVRPPGATHNAYLVHGFSDVHDTPHMRALTAALVDTGHNVAVWDATHSWGRSEGSSELASFYHHHEDLEDVIAWSRHQSWYKDSFVLAGHSLGGMVAGTYAAAHAGQVEQLVLVSPVVSGPALKARLPLPMRWWWRLRGQIKAPGSMNRHSWEFIRSSWAYDLLQSAHRLTMPVLIIGAARDVMIPPRLLRRLFRQIVGEPKRLEIVPGARHGFDQEWEVVRLRRVVEEWIR